MASLEERINPGELESDKDRLLLIQEKEQLLRELRSISPRNNTLTFIGGQLRNVLTRPELFRWTAFVTAGLGCVYVGLYYFIARRSEQRIINELDKKYPQRLVK